MKLTKTLIIIYLLILCYSSTYAKPKIETGFNYALVLPVNSYKSDFGYWRNGLNGFCGYNMSILPLTFGISFNYYWFGSNHHTDTYFPVIKVNTSYKKIVTGLFVKWQYRHGLFQPYLTGQLFNQTLFSNISHSLNLIDEYGYEDESDYYYNFELTVRQNGKEYTAQYKVTSSDKPFRQANNSLGWGIGGGTQIKIYDNTEITSYDDKLFEIKKGIINQVFFDVGIFYFPGNNIDYLKGDTFLKINNENLHIKAKSLSEFITIQCGISLSLF